MTGQTGQSDAIHSPEAWTSVVVRLIKPLSFSIAVVCTVAISCWPRHLRTRSRPEESGAYRKVRLPARGKGDTILAVRDFFRVCDLGLRLLERCSDRLLGNQFKADGAGFRSLGPNSVSRGLLGICGTKAFSSVFSPVMI